MTHFLYTECGVQKLKRKVFWWYINFNLKIMYKILSPFLHGFYISINFEFKIKTWNCWIEISSFNTKIKRIFLRDVCFVLTFFFDYKKNKCFDEISIFFITFLLYVTFFFLQKTYLSTTRNHRQHTQLN